MVPPSQGSESQKAVSPKPAFPHPESTHPESTHPESTSFESTPGVRAHVEVPLADRSYRIEITGGAISPGRLAPFAASLRAALPDMTHAIVIADQSVDSDWATPLASAIGHPSASHQAPSVRASHITVPTGEASKSIDQFQRLLTWILAEGGDRKSVVVAVGGGVVGDLAGYVAASFTRGIRFVQIPTTLLAMVDSSVGGKTGINLPDAKNMVGAFWQPSLVLIDTEVLSTLPQRSYLSGLGEVVKYGMIDDADFFTWLEHNAAALVDRDGPAVSYAIEKSCQSKARVVGQDERETSGRRAILNYGHTFAHAIEATAGYGAMLHGEAVAIGMQMAAHLAVHLNLLDQNSLDRQTSLIQACKLPTTWPDANPDAMMPVMMRDKKVAHGKLRFILPSRIGAVDLVGDVPQDAVVRSIEACKR